MRQGMRIGITSLNFVSHPVWFPSRESLGAELRQVLVGQLTNSPLDFFVLLDRRIGHIGSSGCLTSKAFEPIETDAKWTRSKMKPQELGPRANSSFPFARPFPCWGSTPYFCPASHMSFPRPQKNKIRLLASAGLRAGSLHAAPEAEDRRPRGRRAGARLLRHLGLHCLRPLRLGQGLLLFFWRGMGGRIASRIKVAKRGIIVVTCM